MLNNKKDALSNKKKEHVKGKMLIIPSPSISTINTKAPTQEIEMFHSMMNFRHKKYEEIAKGDL